MGKSGENRSKEQNKKHGNKGKMAKGNKKNSKGNKKKQLQGVDKNPSVCYNSCIVVKKAMWK